MRIGIITLPLHVNFGGFLQNYALQQVLKEMGYADKGDYASKYPYVCS